MEKTTADILEEAADILLINGRCTIVGVSRKRRAYCVLGAIAKARGWDEKSDHEIYRNDDPAVIALANHISPLLDSGLPGCIERSGINGKTSPSRDVYLWNDQIEHSDDFEVIDTLRKVAKDLRNKAAV